MGALKSPCNVNFKGTFTEKGIFPEFQLIFHLIHRTAAGSEWVSDHRHQYWCLDQGFRENNGDHLGILTGSCRATWWKSGLGLTIKQSLVWILTVMVTIWVPGFLTKNFCRNSSVNSEEIESKRGANWTWPYCTVDTRCVLMEEDQEEKWTLLTTSLSFMHLYKM